MASMTGLAERHPSPTKRMLKRMHIAARGGQRLRLLRSSVVGDPRGQVMERAIRGGPGPEELASVHGFLCQGADMGK